MKNIILAFAGVAALALPVQANAQQATVTNGAIVLPVTSANDFQSQLHSVSLDAFTAGLGTNITLSGPATLTFTYMGSESGFSDNFLATSLTGPIFGQENSSGVDNHWPGGGPGGGVALGSGQFAGGSLSPFLLFNSLNIGALPASLGSFGFGVFIPNANTNNYATNVFYIGYDDQATNPDDNHDDYIVRVNVSSPLPEPATWAMMIVGFGAVGFAMRRRKATASLAQLA